MTTTLHDLKVWPEFFAPIIDGRKTFEVRKDDRGFKVGDNLRLREWAPATWNGRAPGYTGREALAHVPYILQGFGPLDGFVVMSIRVFVIPDDEEGGT